MECVSWRNCCKTELRWTCQLQSSAIGEVDWQDFNILIPYLFNQTFDFYHELRLNNMIFMRLCRRMNSY